MLSMVLIWIALSNGILVASQTQDSSDEGVQRSEDEPRGSPSPATPTPSAPEFIVRDRDNIPCVLVTMDATIVIELKRTANKKTTVALPRAAETQGNCGKGEDSTIVLSWGSFRFLWHFKKSRVSDVWYVDKIQLSYNTTDKAFNGDSQGLPGTVQTIKSEPSLNLFLTPIGRSYSCAITKDIKLFDEKKITRITVIINRVLIQPFAGMTQRQYGSAFQCSDQSGGRDETVPIAVGSTLAIVVLLTVAGYAGYRYFKVKKIEYDTME